MTPDAQQPQREYIITMGRIIKARNMLMADGYHNADVLDRMVNLLRSRPHTPAQTLSLTGDTKYYFDAGWEKGYAQGKAEAARTATLAPMQLAQDMYGLMMCIEKQNTEEFMDYFVTKMEEFKLRHESLRQQEQHP